MRKCLIPSFTYEAVHYILKIPFNYFFFLQLLSLLIFTWLHKGHFFYFYEELIAPFVFYSFPLFFSTYAFSFLRLPFSPSFVVHISPFYFFSLLIFLLSFISFFTLFCFLFFILLLVFLLFPLFHSLLPLNRF